MDAGVQELCSSVRRRRALALWVRTKGDLNVAVQGSLEASILHNISEIRAPCLLRFVSNMTPGVPHLHALEACRPILQGTVPATSLAQEVGTARRDGADARRRDVMKPFLLRKGGHGAGGLEGRDVDKGNLQARRESGRLDSTRKS